MKETIIENLAVTAYANEGKSIGHHNGKVIFIKGAVPGEVVNVSVRKSKKDWTEAEVVEVLHNSPDRQQPFCPHFGICGGCQWQHLKYEKQLQYKEQSVADTLERIGKITIGEKLPITGASDDRYYRNKLEFTFSDREWIPGNAFHLYKEQPIGPALGYHLPGAFDRVFDVKTCYLQQEPSDEIRLAIRKFTIENGYEYFNLRKQTGLLRNVMIRIASTGQVMVVVVFAQKDRGKIELLMNFLREKFPGITALQYVINSKKNDTIYDLEVITHSGADAIYERLGDLEFRISAKSFFQTNTQQAEKLYQCIKDFAGLEGRELVYDLYTGTGSIALSIARSCKKVIGIEQVAQAIEDAKMNAAHNQISNADFYAADISKILTREFHAELGTPDVVITDPPRAGMQVQVIDELLEMEPEKIIYVSCNVATQARDLQLLSRKYSVERIRPFDLFPHTHHIENVAELRRLHP